MYKATPPGSPLRRLLVDMHVHHCLSGWVEDGANPEFLIDLVGDLLDVCDVSHKSDPTGQRSSCWIKRILCYTRFVAFAR